MTYKRGRLRKISKTDRAVAGMLKVESGLVQDRERIGSMKFDEPFPWGPNSLKAAELLAENELNLTDVADVCKITRQTLWKWKNHPEFAEAVAQRAADIVAQMHRHFIAKKHKRIATLDRLHKKALDLIEARANDPATRRESGGETGLLVRREKQMGIGQNATIIVEYEFDRALVAEIRGLQEQAARELGQWVEKAEVAQRFTFDDLFTMVADQPGVIDASFTTVVTLDEVKERLEADAATG